jgi:hypothetical protein
MCVVVSHHFDYRCDREMMMIVLEDLMNNYLVFCVLKGSELVKVLLLIFMFRVYLVVG